MLDAAIKILLILTSQATLGDDPRATGVWLEELSTPYYIFVDAGFDVELASIAGGRVPVDPNSLKEKGKNPASVERFLADKKAQAKFESSQKIEAVTPTRYQAIFLPGGHGTMWDLPQSDRLAELLSSAWANGQILAAVCHGPAGLVKVYDSNGTPLVANRRISAFSNTEEAAAGLTDKVPFMLESRLRELGAHYEKGPDFQPFAIQDGRLITGQNPASSERVAELVLKALRQSH